MASAGRPSGGRSPAGWRVESSRGLQWIVCDAMREVPGVAHAFSTRQGPGGEEFDLGAHHADHARFDRRRGLLCRAAGMAASRPLILAQVHGSSVVTGRQAAGDTPPQADAVVCLREEVPGRAAAVRTADCVPILLADSNGRAVAAIHAGWRGTASAVAVRAVETLGRRGVAAGKLLAAIGPAIGPCCYEVGPEVVEAVTRGTGVPPGTLTARGGPRLDLQLANRRQLERAGLRAEAIHSAPWCTACDERLFFSYRRSGGPTGRLMACIGWA